MPARRTGGCASWRTRRAQAPTSLPASSPTLCSHSCASHQVRPPTLFSVRTTQLFVEPCAFLQDIELGFPVSYAQEGQF